MYLLVSFGFYSLAVIGYNLLTFRDCPEDAKQLQEVSIELRYQRAQGTRCSRGTRACVGVWCL